MKTVGIIAEYNPLRDTLISFGKRRSFPGLILLSLS